mmetsp:Transcript_16842/g.43010  ORF Transcript_16842/g.43010 Transcript_16842/m.43010 type:complete len:328 (+) Transcript_16842:45-1028(+)
MEEREKKFLWDKHVEYVTGLDKRKEDFSYWATYHLQVSGMYWGLTTLALLGKLDAMDKEEMINLVTSSQASSGGFGGNVGHDSHLLYTLSAVQVLLLYDALHRIDTKKVVNYIKSLQNEDGSFCGDEWGEVDTRFSYISLSCLSLLGALDEIDKQKAGEYIMKCRNFDGAFGCVPMAESHAGQTFCCVGALAILGEEWLNRLDFDLLGWWLCERQTPSGGLNGRPEKLPDVCYSWWVLSSLGALRRLHWINGARLMDWILDCQDAGGGIADRPGDHVDVYHTFFGVGGLSLCGFPGIAAIDPVYALPVDVLVRAGIQRHWAAAACPA